MQLKINKFAASLLTLLLALTPLQGVVAATAAAGDAHVMMMAEGEPMHHVDAEAAAASDPGQMADCCKGESCALGHCATCVVAACSRSCGVSPPPHESYVALPSFQFSLQMIELLFKPPKA